MSILSNSRDTVTFDPSKKEHREAVHAFLKRHAWADSPLRFSSHPSFGSVAELVKAKLLEWYISQDKLSRIS